MQSPHFFKSVPINRVANTPLSTVVPHLEHCNKSQARVNKFIYQTSLVKKKCSIFSKSHASPASIVLDTESTTEIMQWYEQNLGFDSDNSYNSRESFTEKDRKERERRKKIGLANKGRVPWNKGQKHTAETCELIKQRTKEAMMDPKVRKKMAECPRAHSEKTKERIGASLRKLWAEKLKGKRSRANFISIWAENIAEAARKGGCDEKELDWNSYENIKKESNVQYLKWAADRAKEKEMEKLEVAKRKAEKIARLEREKQEPRVKTIGESKRQMRRKSKEEREELTVSVGLKLKERLTKIHKRKISTNGQLSAEDQRTWEKLDLNIINPEVRREEISLADQIQAAKTKREELDKEKLPTSTFPCSSVEKSAQ